MKFAWSRWSLGLSRPTSSKNRDKRPSRAGFRPAVESLEDRQLLSNVFTVINTNDTGAGSLRAAIAAANSTPLSGGPNVIDFNIGASGSAQTIILASALPAITSSVIIDGSSQPGFTNTPLITIDPAVSKNFNGLELSGGNSTVKDLIITGFGQNGIKIDTFGGDTIQGNIITSNGGDGVLVNGTPNNLIGGATSSLGNVLSGNNVAGVEISNDLTNLNAAFNTVESNRIGTNIAGTAAFGTLQTDGVLVGPGANNNLIGGAGVGNVISGNDVGIAIFGTTSNNSGPPFVPTYNNTVKGNLIGSDVTGANWIGNTFEGVLVQDASSTTIGGTTLPEGNLISGSVDNVVIFASNPTLYNPPNNVVEGNLIGTNLAATATLAGMPTTGPNAPNQVGVVIEAATGSIIGGSTINDGNVISGNLRGVVISGATATQNVVQANTIGTQGNTKLPLGNTLEGVYVINGAGSNTIGSSQNASGQLTGLSNIIAFNGGNGVLIGPDGGPPALQGGGTDTNAGNGNNVLSNAIFSNGAAGIALAGTSNNAQASPTLTSALLSDTGAGTSATTVLTVVGTFTSTANTAFNIQYFASDNPQNNQGKVLITSVVVTTNGAGVGNINLTNLAVTKVNPNQFITATATNLTTGDTSAISNGVIASPILFTDNFAGGPLPSLPQPPWLTNQSLGGGFTVDSSGHAVSSAIVNGLFKATTVQNISLANVSVQADVALNPSPANGTSATGVIVRSQDPNDIFNCYFAALAPGAGGLDQILIEKTVNGQIIGLAAKALPAGTTSGTLRLDVFGNTLTAYFNGQLESTVTDNTYTAAGNVGIGAEDQGATFANFSVSSITAAAISFSDNFARSTSTSFTLGSPWDVNAFKQATGSTSPGGGFQINGSNQARSLTAGLNVAVLYGVSLSTSDVSATVVSSGSGIGAGVVADWNSATQSGYELLLSGTMLQLYTVVNGVQTPLGAAHSAGASSGTVELQVSGGTLTVLFNGASVFSMADATFSSGTVGIAGNGAGTTFSLFTASGS